MNLEVLKTIGKTPLVKLKRMSPRPDAEIYVKLEFFNPSGSIKDRIVDHIINDAEEKNLINPDSVIVENTSGNTGAAVAMISAVKGYKSILVMPDKVSIEKQNTLTALGAKIVVTPTSVLPDHPDHYVKTAKRIAAETPNSFKLDQYDNPKNPLAHYLSTGPEIWEQMNGDLTHFIASGSTGGTISGIGKFLKEKNENIQIIMPDPKGSIYYDYFYQGKFDENSVCNYLIEGVGEDHLAKAMNFSVVDKMYCFEDKDAFYTARRLASEEGIFGGTTGGANVWGAIKLANEMEGPVKIVTVIPDSGFKYLSKLYNDDWMNKHNMTVS